MKSKEKIYSIGAILLIIDQLIKLIIKNKLKLLQEIKIIPKFFSIYYVENKGAAFSILNGKTYIFVIVAIVLLILLNKYIDKEKTFSKLKIFSLGIIIGGIIGNLLDRIIYHSVIDFLAFNILGYSFPVFNIADIGITVGVCLYIIEMVRSDYFEVRSRNKRKTKNR